MAEKTSPGPVDSKACIREAVCISTKKIFDSCRDKDCVEDLRVYPAASSQENIDKALSMRPRSAELLHTQVHVESAGFKKGSYTVDCSYFYKLIGETFPGGELCQGLGIFEKRVMLFGSEGRVKQFSSCEGNIRRRCPELPEAVVSAVDPIALSMRICDPPCSPCGESEGREVPEFIASAFPEPLVFDSRRRRWYATLGQFSIILLQRPTQLLIPAYDYCLPDKECPGSAEDEPCELFSRLRFPAEEFFPPDELCPGED